MQDHQPFGSGCSHTCYTCKVMEVDDSESDEILSLTTEDEEVVVLEEEQEPEYEGKGKGKGKAVGDVVQDPKGKLMPWFVSKVTSAS